jgi:hypothetical protein
MPKIGEIFDLLQEIYRETIHRSELKRGEMRMEIQERDQNVLINVTVMDAQLGQGRTMANSSQLIQ